MVGYLSFLKLGPKILKFLPGNHHLCQLDCMLLLLLMEKHHTVRGRRTAWWATFLSQGRAQFLCQVYHQSHCMLLLMENDQTIRVFWLHMSYFSFIMLAPKPSKSCQVQHSITGANFSVCFCCCWLEIVNRSEKGGLHVGYLPILMLRPQFFCQCCEATVTPHRRQIAMACHFTKSSHIVAAAKCRQVDLTRRQVQRQRTITTHRRLCYLQTLRTVRPSCLPDSDTKEA